VVLVSKRNKTYYSVSIQVSQIVNYKLQLVYLRREVLHIAVYTYRCTNIESWDSLTRFIKRDLDPNSSRKRYFKEENITIIIQLINL
jgi:hypothetical protein